MAVCNQFRMTPKEAADKLVELTGIEQARAEKICGLSLITDAIFLDGKFADIKSFCEAVSSEIQFQVQNQYDQEIGYDVYLLDLRFDDKEKAFYLYIPAIYAFDITLEDETRLLALAKGVCETGLS